MKSYTLAVLSALAATAFAQESASASSTSTSSAPSATSSSSSSLIPEGISVSCKAFLTQLDQDSDVSNCFSALVSATSEFNPSSTAGYSDNTLNTTLTALCNVGTTKCNESKIRAQLAQYYSACQTDLIGDAANDHVKETYDILYILLPLKEAVCAKNTATNKYCVQEIHVDDSTSTSSVGKALIADNSASSGLHVSHETLELLETNLYKVLDNSDYHLGVVKPRTVQPRADDNTTSSLIPDTKVWRETSLVYLFISPDYTAEQLCTSCTKAVLSAYVKFEAATPYALGLVNSPLLGDQLTLWNSLTTKCNTTFTNEILNLAGYSSNPNGETSLSAASRVNVIAGSIMALVTTVAAFLAL